MFSLLVCMFLSGVPLEKTHIVVFKDSVKSVPIVANEMAKTHAFQVNRTYTHALRGFSARISNIKVARLRRDKRISYIEEDRIFSIDQNKGKGNGKGKTKDPLPEPEPIPEPAPDPEPEPTPPPVNCSGEPYQIVPWGTLKVGGGTHTSIYTAWVLDTGIDLNHCDLNVDKARSRSFVSGDTNPTDRHGHGTHVAGTIAAKNNNIGTIGVAPGSSVVSVRVLDSNGSGSNSWIIAGIDYVTSVATAGDVVNMSLGGAGHSQALHDAVIRSVTNRPGLRFVLAAGNSSADASGFEPAHVEHSSVFTISAVNSVDTFASFSNWGVPIDYAAPGVSIVSTKMGGGITSMSGTSMAAPHATGIILLGSIRTRGFAINDPDGKPDPLIAR